MLNYGQNGGVKDKKVGFYRKKNAFLFGSFRKSPYICAL